MENGFGFCGNRAVAVHRQDCLSLSFFPKSSIFVAIYRAATDFLFVFLVVLNDIGFGVSQQPAVVPV